MKKFIIILAICIVGCMASFGQTENINVIKQIDASAEDYITLLNSNGYEAFSFDISSLLDGQYYLSFKIKEYKDGNEVCGDRLRGYSNFRNMVLVSEFPEDEQNNITPEEMDDPERGIFKMAKRLMIGFTPAVNDTIRPIVIDIENMGTLNRQLPLQPQYQNNDSVNGKKIYSYYAKPFMTSEFIIGQFIPLVLLGSVWYDKDFGIHRFCGENEISPDMSSEILKYIPHYYIIGIEVNPMK